MKTEIYDITGMHCAACSSAVERVTRKLPGVSESNVNLTMARLTITYDEALTTEQMICDKVNKAGFGAFLHVQSQSAAQTEDDDAEKSREDKEKLTSLMLKTDEMVADVGSIIDGKQAVEYGLINEIGGLSGAIDALKNMIKSKEK